MYCTLCLKCDRFIHNAFTTFTIPSLVLINSAYTIAYHQVLFITPSRCFLGCGSTAHGTCASVYLLPFYVSHLDNLFHPLYSSPFIYIYIYIYHISLSTQFALGNVSFPLSILVPRGKRPRK